MLEPGRNSGVPIAQGFKETQIGLIPAEWEVKRVVEAYRFTKKPRGLRIDHYEAIPFVPMEKIPVGKMYFRDFILKHPHDISSGTYFEPNDVLVPKITPSFENGKQGIVPDLPISFGFATTEVIPIAEIEGISSREFLFFYLLKDDVRASLAVKMEGSTGRQRLSKDLLEELPIPFPSLAEQRAIASILAQLQTTIAAQVAIAERARELKRALMARLFTEGLYGDDQRETEIGLVPTTWDIVKLGDRVRVQSGGTPSRSNPTYWGGAIPWVKTGEIDYNIIAQTEEHITPAGLANSSARLFPAGTLLMAMYGQGVTRGRVAILGIEAATNQACAALFPDSTLTTPYLFAYLTYAYERVRNFAHGAQQKNLSGEIIKALKIPVPPVDQQREIARIISAIDSRIVAAERKQAGLDELFQTLLQQLMTGRVRVTGE